MSRVEVVIGRSRVMVPDRMVKVPITEPRRGEIPHSWTVETTTDGRKVVFRNGQSWGFLSGGGARRFARNAGAGEAVPDGVEPINFKWHGPPEQSGDSISYGDWEAGTQSPIAAGRFSKHGDGGERSEDVRQWYMVKYATGSDYSGGSLTESNYKELQDMLESAHPSGETPAMWGTGYGGYGTYSVIVVWDGLDEEIREVLEKLDNYPLISEDAHSQLEIEQQDEAWTKWAKKEFEGDFLKAWNARWEDDEEVEEWPATDGDTYTLFRAGMELANENWEDQQGAGQYIDLKPIVKKAVALLAGDEAVPSWFSSSDYDELIEIGLALGMEETPGRVYGRRERLGQQRLPGIKNS